MSDLGLRDTAVFQSLFYVLVVIPLPQRIRLDLECAIRMGKGERFGRSKAMGLLDSVLLWVSTAD